MQKNSLKRANDINDIGLLCARYFKFFSQELNQNIIHPLPFERITAKTLYLEHKYQFNKLADICTKYNINIELYIQYFVSFLKKHERDIDTHLLNTYTFQLYVEYLQSKQKQKNILKYIIKSAKNIAHECIQFGYPHSIDFFKDLIVQKKLVNYYITGKISKYFLVLIPNFPKLVSKLDSLTRDEFYSICNNYEMYQIDSNLALKKYKIHVKNIFTFTDEIIKKYQK